MKKILILYFSGVGATKKIAELIHLKLSQNCTVDIFSIEDKNIPTIDTYDALIVGTPVHHAAPAKALLHYFEMLPKLATKLPAFLYCTRAMTSLHTNRILSQKLKSKNITTILDKEYRSPASDGSIIAPFIKRFFEFEKNLDTKINTDCLNFLELLNTNKMQDYTPRLRFGSILNAPNKLAGQRTTLKIYLHKDKCIKCDCCMKQCPHFSFSIDNLGYPLHHSKNCVNCYRCIHHCPKTALSLSKRRTPRKLLHY